MFDGKLLCLVYLAPLFAATLSLADSPGRVLYDSDVFTVYSDGVVRGDIESRAVADDGGVVILRRAAEGAEDSWRPGHDVSAHARFTCGHPIIEAAYAMALDNYLLCINDEKVGYLNASAGRPPWVRDTGYVSLFSSALMFPTETRDTLAATVDKGRSIKPEQLYSVWSGAHIIDASNYTLCDYNIWIPGAWEYALVTGDFAFLEEFSTEISNAVRIATHEKFDPVHGLYNGGAFGDGDSAYPEGAMGRVPLKGASTNAIYCEVNRILAELAGLADADREERLGYVRNVFALKDVMNERFWIGDDRPYYGQLLVGEDAILEERSAAMAEIMSIWFGVAPQDRVADIVAHTPDSKWGIPLVWPIYGNRGPYHDQTTWPFIEGFWGMANARTGNAERFMKAIATLTEVAVTELTFKELTLLAYAIDRSRAMTILEAIRRGLVTHLVAEMGLAIELKRLAKEMMRPHPGWCRPRSRLLRPVLIAPF